MEIFVASGRYCERSRSIISMHLLKVSKLCDTWFWSFLISASLCRARQCVQRSVPLGESGSLREVLLGAFRSAEISVGFADVEVMLCRVLRKVGYTRE